MDEGYAVFTLDTIRIKFASAAFLLKRVKFPAQRLDVLATEQPPMIFWTSFVVT